MESRRRTYLTRPVGKAPSPASLAVSKSMRSNKKSGTMPELVLARLLRRRLVHSKLPGSPDFVYPMAKVAIFVHGCWWHACPQHSKPPKTHTLFWRRKFARNVERDRINKEELESMGWGVLEIWEHDIKERPRETAARIKAAVHESRLIIRRTVGFKTGRVS